MERLLQEVDEGGAAEARGASEEVLGSCRKDRAREDGPRRSLEASRNGENQ